MGKYVNDDLLDLPLEDIQTNGNKITVCSAQPTTYAEANATYALADVVVDSSDYSIADGASSGRALTVAAQNAVPVDSSGTATHVAIIDTVNSVLKYVTTVTSQALTAGNSVNIPSFKLTFPDVV